MLQYFGELIGFPKPLPYALISLKLTWGRTNSLTEWEKTSTNLKIKTKQKKRRETGGGEVCVRGKKSSRARHKIMSLHRVKVNLKCLSAILIMGRPIDVATKGVVESKSFECESHTVY